MFSLAIFALSAALVASHTINVHHTHEDGSRCGTRHPGQQEVMDNFGLTQRFVSKVCSADPTVFFCEGPEAESVVVYVDFAFHIIHAGPQGNLTDNDVQKQMTVLNEDYGGRNNATSKTNFQFTLVNTTRTNNADWFNNPQRYERDFKAYLANSPATTMNNYFTNMNGGLLGWCYFPSDFPEDSSMSGCVNLYSSIPDGGASPYDGGQTVVHEIGHGFGLYHVFQGGSASCTLPCATSGDLVCDTWPQATSSSGCPLNKDSCPGEGNDNINNYMDYSIDSCMNQFTPGQSLRMDQQIALHKPGYLGEELVAKIRRAAPDAWDEVKAYRAKKTVNNLDLNIPKSIF